MNLKSFIMKKTFIPILLILLSGVLFAQPKFDLGLKAGIKCSGTIIVVFLEIFLAVFSAPLTLQDGKKRSLTDIMLEQDIIFHITRYEDINYFYAFQGELSPNAIKTNRHGKK